MSETTSTTLMKTLGERGRYRYPKPVSAFGAALNNLILITLIILVVFSAVASAAVGTIGVLHAENSAGWFGMSAILLTSTVLAAALPGPVAARHRGILRKVLVITRQVTANTTYRAPALIAVSGLAATMAIAVALTVVVLAYEVFFQPWMVTHGIEAPSLRAWLACLFPLTL